MHRHRWRIGLAVLTAVLSMGIATFAILIARPAAPAPLDTTHSVWWNEGAVSLVDMTGSFDMGIDDMGIDGSLVRFRPEHDECSVTLLVEQTGEVIDYPLTTAGELVLALGWVIVNQGSRDTLNMEASTSSGGCDFPSGCDELFAREDITSVDYSGDCWESAEVPDQGCKWEKFCGSSGSEGCVVTVSTGDGQTFTYSSACGGGLVIKQCNTAPEGSLLCVCAP